MKTFLHEDFLLPNKTAQTLYHEYAAKMPIVDYHNHLSPEIAVTNRPFANMTDIWLKGDHYKWRAMRTMGVAEKYITGNATDHEKFMQWAKVVPHTIRNPLFHWSHMELKNPFGIDKLLNEGNAETIFQHCNNLLKQPEFSPRGLLDKFNVEVIVTTDDPSDDLQWHRQMAKEQDKVIMLPAFRSDKIFQINQRDFQAYLQKLGNAAGLAIHSLNDLFIALQNRIDFFAAHGCCLADYGLSAIPFCKDYSFTKADLTLKKMIEGNSVLAEEEVLNYQLVVLLELCKMYHQKQWVQQFHLGALRNVNTRLLNLLGADAGVDVISSSAQVESLAFFLNELDQNNQLAKTILYNLSPADNEQFAALAGAFQGDGIQGKVQYGAAWWFLDQKDGIEKQLDTLSNIGLLSCFVGMLTDSRSFLSFSRHEYFRRVLCAKLGQEMEQGILPNDISGIGELIKNISYFNAKKYFNFKCPTSKLHSPLVNSYSV
ncbi:glucuronate isomerase [Solitalea koreensis]|uniref:Uronate isomerase n=1 Tax=Solitalea koreensis TaxID=543615 RepID=A0A521CKW5_9SPHI|nr:glucuronate isomerase [Solitalea koreensis]SMO60089.1 D-glucuronate isomerase [Solitalea koreensis]